MVKFLEATKHGNINLEVIFLGFLSRTIHGPREDTNFIFECCISIFFRDERVRDVENTRKYIIRIFKW